MNSAVCLSAKVGLGNCCTCNASFKIYSTVITLTSIYTLRMPSLSELSLASASPGNPSMA